MCSVVLGGTGLLPPFCEGKLPFIYYIVRSVEMAIINEFGVIEELDMEDALQRLMSGMGELLDDDVVFQDIMEWN